VLSLKTVDTLRRLSSLFVKQPLLWDFVIEALSSKFAPFLIAVLFLALTDSSSTCDSQYVTSALYQIVVTFYILLQFY